MNKAGALKITNGALFISLAVQAVTAISLFFNLLKPGSKLFETADEVHSYNGLLLIALVCIHLYLNWGWIKSQFLK